MDQEQQSSNITGLLESPQLDARFRMLASPIKESNEKNAESLDAEEAKKTLLAKETRLRTGTVTTAGKYLENLSNPKPPPPPPPTNQYGDLSSSSNKQGRVLGTSNTDISEKQMDKFLSGFKRFRKAQKPKTVLLGCCDSRVDPAIITDCDPGDLFVIRNVANLVAPYQPDAGYHGVAAALEFAVQVLCVENIIVLGHSKCGGISALLRGVSSELEFIAPWVSIAQKAKDKTLKYFGDRSEEEQQRACEHASILQTIENLVTYPWIHSKLQRGDLNLTGWYFDFESGDLMGYNPDTLDFEALVDNDCSEHASPTRSLKNACRSSGSSWYTESVTKDEHSHSSNLHPKSE
ncbi:hypothetical protein BASA61_007670 [Batrachochytrium salamandrivorans]|nr:hypothetical protein BASA61_007670 [Batrachochytrium salamandrivorans]